MAEARIFMSDKSQTQYAISTVTNKTTGMVIFAEILNPASIIAAIRIGKKARKE